MVRNVLLVGIAMVLVAWSGPPTNLVGNGSFSNLLAFTDWTLQSCSGICNHLGWARPASLPDLLSGTPPPGITTAADTGCNGAGCNDPANGATISQTLMTVPGQAYTLSFYYDAGSQIGGPGTTELTVLWNNLAVTGGTISNATANTWTQYTFTVVATGASTTLEFTGRQDPQVLYLTGISVTPNAGGGPPNGPIPGTLLLAMMGLAGLALYQLRGKLLRRPS
jgi:hypothetical protein